MHLWFCFLQGLKKHKLLREDILPALASNRKVQRLLNEFMDLLSEYGSADTHSEQNISIPPMLATRSTDRMDMIPSLNDHMQVDAPAPVVDQIIDLQPRKPEQGDSAPSTRDHQMVITTVPVDQINQISVAEDRVTLTPGKDDVNLVMVKDQVNLLPSSAEPMNIDTPKTEKVVVALPAKEHST